MEIIVEVGTNEQKQLIEQELAFLDEVVEKSDPPVDLHQVIVASDFELKINELEGINTYKASRGEGSMRINAMARVAKLKDGFAIVLSPLLYSELQDTQTRLFTVFHEFRHVINKRDFPPIPNESYIKAQYLHNLYSLYDEYSSDRFAYGLLDNVFNSKSHFWDSFVQSEADGFIGLITDPQYYDGIRNEIQAFRLHANVELFLNKTRRYFDEVAISLAHIWALSHHYPDRAPNTDLLSCPFVNDRTIALMEYFKGKSERKSNDLLDGMDLIIQFMTNFGVKFEHRDYGGYCYVLDI